MHFFVFIISYPFIIVVSLLPHRLLYIISDFISIIFYKLFKYRLKTVKKNISLSFPDVSNTDLIRIERAFYKHMCDVFIEMIKSITISEREMKKRFQFKNIELVHSFHDKNKSVLLLCGHYSSWEGMLSIGYHLKHPAYGIYTPLSNKYFDRLISRSRERHNAFLLSRYKTIYTINKDFENGLIALYGFAMDQSPSPSPSSYWKSFMGIEVPVFKGAEMIAKKYNYPVLYTAINRYKRGYYQAEVSLISEFPKQTKNNQITDLFYSNLESQIKKDPSQYLWTHNRFKHMNSRD